MNTKMICIVGRTGSGKDSLTNKAINIAKDKLRDIHLIKNNPFEIVVSYTTRPIRNGEPNNAHIFITEEEYKKNFKHKEKIAETEINGYHYFVLDDQIQEMWDNKKIPVYIIDPVGLYYLVNNKYDIISKDEIYTVYIHASTEERMKRYYDREIKDTNSNHDKLDIMTNGMKRNSSENKMFKEFEEHMFDDDFENYVNTLLFNSDGSKDTNIMILSDIMIQLYIESDFLTVSTWKKDQYKKIMFIHNSIN